MKESKSAEYEMLAASAFNKQSVVFDDIYAHNKIVAYKRNRVRAHVLSLINSESHILELNAGTGDDAVFFAKQGFTVHATDIAADMLNQLQLKVDRFGLNEMVSTEVCSFTQLENLKDKGPFDLIFSNFGGLNCTDNLIKVLDAFDALLKPGGLATMVIMPGFCLWETMLALKGKFKIAFRRFNSKKGAPAHIEGVHFLCWYYSPGYIIRHLKDKFELLDVEALCTIVPPSYFENFPEKYPKKFNWLCNMERRFKNKFLLRSIGDYFIISLRKKYQKKETKILSNQF